MVLRTSFILLALSVPVMALAAQSPDNTGPTQTAVQTNLPSATLQPALGIVKQAIYGLSIDRWKASPAIRSEAQANLQSVQHDLSATLPSLLSTADAAPSSPVTVLPVYRNVEALYDVTLRLVVAARLAAPNDQMSALDQALSHLDDARRALGDQLQQDADSQDRQVAHLQAALKAVPPPLPPPPPPAAPVKCAPTPVHKKKVTTAAKPTTPPASSQAPH